MEDRVHRLLNAVEPGTYVRPHRHLMPSRTETVIVVAGRLGLVLFDGDGSVSSRIVLTPQLQAFGAEIPAGLYHSFIALERGTVMFEVKEGPYAPVDESDMALWAPGEEDPAAASWVSGQEGAFRQLAAETVKVA
jgi:cupin fold WbuC family metalloprotein